MNNNPSPNNSNSDIEAVERNTRRELISLARDDNPANRLIAAEHTSTPMLALAWLLDDVDSLVRHRAMEVHAERLVDEYGYQVVGLLHQREMGFCVWTQELATKRLEKALRRYAGLDRTGHGVPLVLPGYVFDRLVDLPRAVAKALADRLETLADLDGYTPIAEVVEEFVPFVPAEVVDPAEVLEELEAAATSNSFWDRSDAARNPFTPVGAVVGLIDDVDALTRRDAMDVHAERLVAEAGCRVVEGKPSGGQKGELATKRIEKALRRYTGIDRTISGNHYRGTPLVLAGDTYDRLVDLPRAVATATGDLLEFLAQWQLDRTRYTPIAEVVDAAEALAALPKYRQEAAWAVLEENPDQPLRAVRSVARAGGLTG
ncbi:MAG: hypothetical protein GY882_07840 [Actinomycetia bacterium]|nr:hypothetical protein [Actinomycetes bacterium]